ncbi:MAG TPA: hypothetical protein VJJ46_09695 [Anaerolineales bacterium]|nr:hypothetical protein [Anaerolineales bacterium]
MAKKRTAPETRVLFGARIPVDLHKLARHYAIDRGIKMRDVLELALREFLDREKRRPISKNEASS